MSVFRNRSTSPYTSIPNALLRNKDLPDTAGWLLVNLLSNVSEWRITIVGLANTRRFGNVGKVQKSLDVLRELGYVRLTKLSDGRSIWDVTDTPWQFGDDGSEPEIENRIEGRPDHDNRLAYKKNIDLKNQSKKTPYSPPEGEVNLFEIFWEKYPRKQGKENAIKAFKKHKFDHKTLPPVLDALDAHKRIWDTQDKQFTPLPATWLNGKRWEDELEDVRANEIQRPRRYFN